MKCAYPACERAASHCKMCSKHYRRLLRHGIPRDKKTVNKVGISKCIVSDCEGKYWAKGFCNKHYKRFRKLNYHHVKL